MAVMRIIIVCCSGAMTLFGMFLVVILRYEYKKVPFTAITGRRLWALGALIWLVLTFAMFVIENHIREHKLAEAEQMMTLGNYAEAADLYKYGYAYDEAAEASYLYVEQLCSSGNYEEAKKALASLAGYEEYEERAKLSILSAEAKQTYEQAMSFYENGEYQKALEYFTYLKGYAESDEMAEKCESYLEEE